MAYGFMIESRIAATNVDALNRSAISTTVDVAGGGLVSLTAPTTQGDDRYTAAAPAAGSLGDLWMAYNPSYHTVTVDGIPNGQFAGLSIDPRVFTNPMNRTFSIFKPMKYDNIVVSVDAVSGITASDTPRGLILEGSAGSTLLTKVASHTAGNTAFKIEWQGALPFPQAGIGNQYYTAYKLECIEA